MNAAFQLDGQDFVALNGGPQYKFTPAISSVVKCETQQEMDDFWRSFQRVDVNIGAGWLQDKFGVSWQFVPTVLSKLLQDKDPERSKRIMQCCKWTSSILMG
jgi:predicted 3-demethylubiquinone-9 3-methyltransferase (glyoxalase superfamily)